MIGRRLMTTLVFCLGSAACATVSGQADSARVAAAYPELKVLQEGGLPVRFAREDWAGARRTVTADAGWGNWLASRRRAVDRWMSQPRDKAEWLAGFIHDLIDPATQRPLRWSEDMPEPPRARDRDSKLHAAWVAGTRPQNIAYLLEAARLYRLTDETRYADWAAGQLDFYARNFAAWPLRSLGGKARLMAQGLDDATATVNMIQAVRLLRGHVDAERIANWRDRLFLPIAANLGNSPNKLDNIRLWQNTARALIGMEFGDESLVRDSLDGEWGTRAVLRQGVGRDFLWIEGSLGYQTYVLRALAPLFIEAAVRGRGSELASEMLMAQNMLLAPIAMRFDDGSLPNPADSTARPRAIDVGLHMEVYRALPSLVSLNDASRHKNWNLLLDPPATTGLPPTRLPEVVSHHYPDASMAILRAGPWQVFLNYGQHAPNHAQPEALNTEIYFQEIPVSTDPGTVSYGARLHKGYFRQAAAANVALVDGEGQEGTDPGRMDDFSVDPPKVSASQPRYRKDAEARREIAFQGDALIDELSIRLTDDQPAPRRLGFLFHTDCAVRLEGAGSPSSSEAPSGRGMEYWRDVLLREPASRAWDARLECGQRTFTGRFSVSGAHRLYTAIAPSTPLPATRNVIYVELQDRQASLEMRLTPAGTPP